VPAAKHDYHTFVPARGNDSVRIDYICTNDGMQCVPRSMHINDSVSIDPSVRRDHRPLQCKVVPVNSSGSSPHKRRVVKYDVHGLCDPVKASNFTKIMDSMPPACIEVDNTSHCLLVEEFVRDALESCFPIPKQSKKCLFLGDDTLIIVAKGHRLAKKLNGLELSFFQVCLICCVWHLVRSVLESQVECVLWLQ
jgi:hypothetical protein